MGFTGGSAGKDSACNVGDLGWISGSGRSLGEGTGYPLQDCWASLVAQLVKNPPAVWETWVGSLGGKDPLEKEELPTPGFWPGEFHGLYSPWGRKEWDRTERHFHFQIWRYIFICLHVGQVDSVLSNSLQPHGL